MSRTYRAPDGRDWIVTLESPGKVLSVSPSLEKSGAMLPEHQIQIVFSSGEDRMSEEYTELSSVEDLSEDDLLEWWEAAREQKGI